MLIHCPLHDDSKPSCSIDVDRGLYLCFGCGARGDLFSLALLTGVSVANAARMAFDEGPDTFASLAGTRPKDWAPPVLVAPTQRALGWLQKRGIEVNDLGEVTNIVARRLPRFEEGEDVLGILVWCAVSRDEANPTLEWEQWRYYRVMRQRKEIGKYYATPGFPRGRVIGLGGEREGSALYVAEGSLDSLAVLLAQQFRGIPSGSSYYTFGAKVTTIQASLLATLRQGKRLILAYDNDQDGLDATLSWLRVFPDAEVLQYPGKDPGEAILMGGSWEVRDGMEFLVEHTR